MDEEFVPWIVSFPKKYCSCCTSTNQIRLDTSYESKFIPEIVRKQKPNGTKKLPGQFELVRTVLLKYRRVWTCHESTQCHKY